MTNLFTAEDYENEGLAWPQTVADISNRILNERLLKSGVSIYKNKCSTVAWFLNSGTDDTHRALLINIEEIKKVECPGHEPIVLNYPSETYVCKHCNVKLKQTWEPA